MDRRVNRTRNALAEALVRVMLQEQWDQINVQRICDEADISRSTFYVHFTGKEDLLDHCFTRLEDELRSPSKDRGLTEFGTFSYLPNLIAHVKSHCDLFQINARSNAGRRIFRRFQFLVARLSREEFDRCKDPAVSTDQIVFITGGIFAMLEAWNDNRCRDSQVSIIRRIDCLVSQLLGKPIEQGAR